MYKSSINIYIFVQSLAVTDKQESVSLNIISVDLSAFSDFVNVFIRYRSKKNTSQLSLMVTEMVFTMVFFPIIKLFLQNEKFNKFCRCFLKNYNLHNF